MSYIRTFLAVEISPEVRSSAAALVRQLQMSVPGPKDVKWVDTKAMHITLQFLGDVEDREIATLCNVVAETVAALPPFDFLVRGLGAFPNLASPRALWLGLDEEGAANLIRLKETLDGGLEELGYRRESRRFMPHLTIGRVMREGLDFRPFAAGLAEFEAGITGVDEVVVFSSERDRGGSTYEAMSRAELKGHAAESGQDSSASESPPFPDDDFSDDEAE